MISSSSNCLNIRTKNPDQLDNQRNLETTMNTTNSTNKVDNRESKPNTRTKDLTNRKHQPNNNLTYSVRTNGCSMRKLQRNKCLRRFKTTIFLNLLII